MITPVYVSWSADQAEYAIASIVQAHVVRKSTLLSLCNYFHPSMCVKVKREGQCMECDEQVTLTCHFDLAIHL